MQLMPIDLVRGDVELPSLSVVFQQFTTKLDDPGARAEDFAEIISTDTALTVRLLKLVNSAYYSFSSTITDVPHAITIIGLNELRDMILAISVVEFFDGLPNELVSMQTFWQHSVLTGLLAKEMQTSPQIKSRQSLFTAGMLHDVGSLVIFNRLPEQARAVLERQQREDRPRHLVERDVIGFDHAAVGAELMKHWELPEFLVEVVGCHLEPKQAGQFAEETGVVDLANRLAALLSEQEMPGEAMLQELMRGSGDSLRLTVSDLEAAIEQAKEKLGSVLAAVQST